MFLNVKEIEAADLAEWLSDNAKDFRIIDVREINEINAGTIPGAEAMPMATVPVRIHELDKDKDLVLICRSGARSAQACAFLQQQGYDNVYNLRGGMFAWAGSGQPLGFPKAV